MALKLCLLASAVLVLLVIENASGGAVPADTKKAAGGASPSNAGASAQTASLVSGQPASLGSPKVAYSAIPHDTDCTYHFWTQKRTWSQADSYCQGQGMELAAPKSRSQQSELERQFRGRQDFWIGVHDKDHESRWYFTDHYVGEARFFNWQWGQPDGGYRQNCVQMNKYGDGKWDDAECYLRKSFVCQRCTAPHWGH